MNHPIMIIENQLSDFIHWLTTYDCVIVKTEISYDDRRIEDTWRRTPVEMLELFKEDKDLDNL